MGQTAAMPDEMDPRKVRIGLAMVAAVVVVAVALATIVDSPLARAVMVGIAVLGIIRAFLLYRSVRRGQPEG